MGWTLRTRKRAIEGGVSVVMAGGCSSPFYNGRGGAHRGGGGESRRGVKTSPGISRLEARRRGVAGGDEKKWQRSASGGGRGS
jgi:hypothetical protein